MDKKLNFSQTVEQPFKTAIMGGGFDPFHLAHLNSLLTVKEKFQIDQILLIPSFKTPLKKRDTSGTAFHRLNMLEKMAELYSFIQIDKQEISRKGWSYTYKTIQELSKERKDEELFFIMGLDQFSIFEQWKNYDELLKKSHLIVTSRPGLKFPKRRSDFPKTLQSFVKSSYLKEGLLNGVKKISYEGEYKNIFFLPLKDMDISSSDIRQRVRNNNMISHLLPQEVDSYIKQNQLYLAEEEEERNSKKWIDFIIEELEAKKAYNIECYDLRSKSIPFSFGLIASASNMRQTKSLAQNLKKKIRENFQLKPLSEEGGEASRWIVLDYGDLVVHLFYDYTRRFYNLEELWESSKCENHFSKINL